MAFKRSLDVSSNDTHCSIDHNDFLL